MSRFLLFLPLAFFLTFPLAFGSVDSFSTNKSLYHMDDQLVVSGNVNYDPDLPFVTVQIFTPGKSTFADFDTLAVNSDGSFSTVFHVGGPTWPSDGSYIVKVTYGGSSEQSIDYMKSLDSLEETHVPEETHTTEESSNAYSLKSKIENFPSTEKSPQYYFDRYNNEPEYKSWFDSQFPSNSVDEVVGYKPTHVDNFPSTEKSPQYYFDRYNNEPEYKSWFDSQFPNTSIHNVLGYDTPVPVPDWIKNNAEWWATGDIDDDVFLEGIEFMVKNNVILISETPSSSETSASEQIPPWIRNSAHWWSQDLISDDEFLTSLKFLIQERIIVID